MDVIIRVLIDIHRDGIMRPALYKIAYRMSHEHGSALNVIIS